jgi:hypothetical protein
VNPASAAEESAPLGKRNIGVLAPHSSISASPEVNPGSAAEETAPLGKRNQAL